MTTFVYLAYNFDGDLLYVGHTRDVKQRMACHGSTAEWPGDVARLVVEQYDNAGEARLMERAYIEDLEPLHNIQGNPRHNPAWYEVDRVKAEAAA